MRQPFETILRRWFPGSDQTSGSDHCNWEDACLPRFIWLAFTDLLTKDKNDQQEVFTLKIWF